MNTITRVWSALALLGLLAVGVGGGVSSFLAQQRQRAEIAATGPKATPISQDTKTSDSATGGAKETKTDDQPTKTSAANSSSGKTSPSAEPGKTEVPPAVSEKEVNKKEVNKEPAPKGEKAAKPTVEPNDAAKTNDTPPATTKENGSTGEKSAKPSVPPGKSSDATKTNGASPSATSKETPTTREKAAKPSSEPSKAAKTPGGKETPPAATTKENPATGEKTAHPSAEPSKASETAKSGKEKPGDKIPPAFEPGKAPESSKAALKTTPKPEVTETPSGDDVATIIVQVPADAKVFFDGQPTQQTGSERTFVTPTLHRGEKSHYELKTEFVSNGRTIKTTVRIDVRAGQMTRIETTATGSRILAPAAPK